MTGITGKKSLRKHSEWEPPVSPHRGRSQRGHVVEGMIKLLTDGFVLQLLSVELICQSRGQQEQASKKCGEEKRPQEEDGDRQKATAAKGVGEENKRRKQRRT